MKKILVIIMLMLSLSLMSCASAEEQYVDLMICIDKMVEANDNEAVSEEEKTELLSSYIKETSNNYTYEIDQDLTYDNSKAIKKIAFGFTFYGDNQRIHKRRCNNKFNLF